MLLINNDIARIYWTRDLMILMRAKILETCVILAYVRVHGLRTVELVDKLYRQQNIIRFLGPESETRSKNEVGG